LSEITVLLVLDSEERHIEEWPGSLFIFGSALNISNLAMRGILKELVELIAKAY